MNEAPPRLVVFTDLDGTLLRHDDYDWSAAAPAVEALRGLGIPIVIASSKTRAEVRAWRDRIGSRDPYIVENGAALFVPEGALPAAPEGADPVPGSAGGEVRVVLGVPYAELRGALAGIAGEIGIPLRGFGDMDRDEVAARTALRGGDLDRALAREYDEPFVPVRPLTDDEERRLEAAAAARGLRVTRGGRFHHLAGAGGKGAAARRLLEAYAAGGAPVRSLGIGDGPNDLDLLEAAALPAIVARPDGTHAPELVRALPWAVRTRGVGPEGFAEAVFGFLADQG